MEWSTSRIPEAYRTYRSYRAKNREKILAENILANLNDHSSGEALVILNAPHSYQFYNNKFNRKSATAFVNDSLQGKIVNVNDQLGKDVILEW